MTSWIFTRPWRISPLLALGLLSSCSDTGKLPFSDGSVGGAANAGQGGSSGSGGRQDFGGSSGSGGSSGFGSSSGASGSAGSGPGICPTQFSYDYASCDSCMRTSCCYQIQQCDVGSSCWNVDECRFANCGGSYEQTRDCAVSYCSGAMATWTDYYDCMAGSCASPCGVEFSPEPQCESSWSHPSSSCDDCLRNSCCDWVQACDYGTGCRQVDDCQKTYCSGWPSSEVESCVYQYCTYLDYGYLSQWSSYWSCMRSGCSGSCATP